MKTKNKVVLSISIDRQISNLMKESIVNRSKYIEWLIYQDMKDKNIDGVEKILI